MNKKNKLLVLIFSILIFTLTVSLAACQEIPELPVFRVLSLIHTEGGSVSGGGTYEEGTEVTVTAEAFSGYSFAGWYQGESQKSDKLVYTFTMPDNNLALRARFTKQAEEEVTYDVTVETGAGGTVVGAGNKQIGEFVRLKAQPDKNYYFDGWYHGTQLITEDIEYSFYMPAAEVVLAAKFAAIKHNVYIDVIGDGSVGDISESYAAGEKFSLSPVAGASYVFSSWYEGEEFISDEANYVFTMTEGDFYITAEFSLVVTEFESGDGSEESPYIISNAGHLYYLSENVNSFENYSLDKYFKLEADIDLNGEEWTAIGHGRETEKSGIPLPEYSFAGHFDGGGHTVSNFKVTQKNHEITHNDTIYGGLFGSTRNATIKNVNITGFYAEIVQSGAAFVGGLVGRLVDSTVIGCHAQGEMIADTEGDCYFGILIGASEMNTAEINKSSAMGTISGNTGYFSYMGLICGSFFGKINDCQATGDININGCGSVFGGIIAGGSWGFITNAFAWGNVEIVAQWFAYAGGIAGVSNGNVINAYAEVFAMAKSIEDDGAAGAIAGIHRGTTANAYYPSFGFVAGTGTEIGEGSLYNMGFYTGDLCFDSEVWELKYGYYPRVRGSFFDWHPIPKENPVGSLGNPFEINSANGLLSLSQNDGYASRAYRLTSNIDLGGAEWTPLGQKSEMYCSLFDGGEYTISNFKISGKSGIAGFIGYNSGNIKNLTLKDFTIDIATSDEASIGGLIGHNIGNIKNCHVKGGVFNIKMLKGFFSLASASVGGIIGVNEQGAIVNCTADVKITVSGDEMQVGGVVGKLMEGSLNGSHSKGSIDVVGMAGANVGGITGQNYEILADCSSDINIKAVGVATSAGWMGNNLLYIGGITGWGASEVVDCTFSGKVTATADEAVKTEVAAGGIAGFAYADIFGCTFDGEVYASSADVKANAGGISGVCMTIMGFCTTKGKVVSNASGTAIAHAGGITGYVLGYFIDVSSTAEISARSDQGNAYAGGIGGYSYGYAQEAYYNGKVKAESVKGAVYVGGIFGENSLSHILYSNAAGSVYGYSAEGYVYAGGLSGSISANVACSYASNDVKAEAVLGEAYAGGIIGMTDTLFGYVYQIYATGDVEAISRDGDALAGGIAGFSKGGVTDAYATGAVTAISINGDAYAGGIVAHNMSIIGASYALCEVLAQTQTGDAFAGGLSALNEYYFSEIYIDSSFVLSGSATARSAEGNATAAQLAAKVVLAEFDTESVEADKILNSYYYTGFVVTIKIGETVSNTPSNSFGTEKIVLSEFYQAAFYTDVLKFDTEKKWDITVLSEDNGILPAVILVLPPAEPEE